MTHNNPRTAPLLALLSRPHPPRAGRRGRARDRDPPEGERRAQGPPAGALEVHDPKARRRSGARGAEVALPPGARGRGAGGRCRRCSSTWAGTPSAAARAATGSPSRTGGSRRRCGARVRTRGREPGSARAAHAAAGPAAVRRDGSRRARGDPRRRRRRASRIGVARAAQCDGVPREAHLRPRDDGSREDPAQLDRRDRGGGARRRRRGDPHDRLPQQLRAAAHGRDRHLRLRQERSRGAGRRLARGDAARARALRAPAGRAHARGPGGPAAGDPHAQPGRPAGGGVPAPHAARAAARVGRRRATPPSASAAGASLQAAWYIAPARPPGEDRSPRGSC